MSPRGVSRERGRGRLRGSPALWSIALGLALLLLGGLFAAAPLYPPGVAFALLGTGALAWVTRASAGASVRRELSATRVVEDQPLRMRLEVRCRRGSLPGGELRDPLLARSIRVAPGRDHLGIPIEVRFARRGRRVLAAPQLVVRDALNLAARSVPGAGEADELLVLPRTEPVRPQAGVLDARGARGRSGLRATVAESDLDGVRSYREGAPASRIHWSALARGAGLVERRFRGEADRLPLVVLDARADAGPAADVRLDAAVRAAASLCLELAAAGGCALLLPGERRPRPLGSDLAAWPALHARLALVAHSTSPPWSATLASHPGAVVYVSARPPRAGQSRRGSPARMDVLVVPGRWGSRAPRFEVSGCAGYLTPRGAHTTAETAA